MEPSAGKFDIKALVSRRKLDLGILFGSIIFGILLNWDAVEIIIFAVFIWSIIGPILSRYLALPAIFFLSFTPILLLLNREERAEEFAVYAYYFLVMTVIRGIIEVRNEKNSEENTKKL